MPQKRKRKYDKAEKLQIKKQKFIEQRRQKQRQNCEKQRQKLLKKWKTVVRKFEKSIRMGYTCACVCCGRLWPEDKVTFYVRENVKEHFSDNYLEKMFFLNNHEGWFCRHCIDGLKNKEIPKFSLSNGLMLPHVDPTITILNRVEERLIAPSHVFQTIWPVMGPNGQFKGKGSIVNVPCNLDNTVTSIPRSITNTNMIHIRLAKKLEYSSDYLTGWARPKKIYDAAKVIVTKPLLCELGISLSEEFYTKNVQKYRNFSDLDSSDESFSDASDYNAYFCDETQETLLINDIGIRMAPAEGYKPRSVLLDKDADFLAFPKIFGGYRMHPMHKDKPLSYSDFTKSMIMSYDNRVRNRPDYILFMAKKLDLLKMQSNINVCLRKKSIDACNTITSANMLNSNFVSGLVQHDDGFKILRGIRSSGAHWQQEKYKVLAMIRQFGLPTFFITVSSADTRWPELLVQLKKNVDNEKITEEEAVSLSYNEKSKLIQSDPVTCALHFDKRFKALKKTWNQEGGPFNGLKIAHSYYRVEFQKRGSPHIHMLIWLENAVLFSPQHKDSYKEVCTFIDEVISCSSEEMPDELIELQRHHHTKTCQKKFRSKEECRFGIPYYPMDRTRILGPLPDSFEDSERKSLKKIVSKINKLKSKETTLNLTFEEFLNQLNIDVKIYILAIRSVLNKYHVFLMRSPADMYINPFSFKIISLMRSNMDIQFILDPYGVACYIIDYINKCDSGMSGLMATVLKEIREGNFAIKDALKKITNTFYNNSELCVQEACYNVIQIPLSQASEDCIFIPTSPPSERIRMVKSEQELKSQNPESTNIFVPNLVEHYEARPSYLEDLCLASFAANYSFTYKIGPPHLKLRSGTGYMTERCKPRVIRFRNYSYNIEPENYFREQCMLFMPFRNELQEILHQDAEYLFIKNRDLIFLNREVFYKVSDSDLTNAMEEASTIHVFREMTDDEEETTFQKDKKLHEKDEFNYVDVENEISNSDRFQNIEFFKCPNIVPQKKFQEMFENLNQDQRDYITHVGHLYKTDQIPFYHLVTGGAGVGKSLLISVLYQTLIRIFNKEHDANPDTPFIIVCAPTGVAAFLIKGQTIHCIFRLPINQKHINELSADVSNTFRTLLAKVKLVIIDEISMVGQSTLHMIDQRLKHFFNPNKIFGGISVIAVGDFFQLKPVMARCVYSPSNDNPYQEIFGEKLWDNFEVYKLHKIMRQQNKKFQTALNNLAKGELTKEDVSLFLSRSFESVPSDVDGCDTVHLFPYVKDVDDWNNKAIKSFPGTQTDYEAIDVIGGTGSNSAKRQIMFSVKNSKRSDTMGIPQVVNLKLKGRYMLTYNIDTSDGLCNGCTGTLEKIDCNKNGNPIRLWFLFDDESVGTKKRNQTKALSYNMRLPTTWTPVEPIAVKIKTRKNSSLHVVRKQFPFVLAYAMTIHKSQGKSMKKVVVHLAKFMRRDSLYVACSRATTLNGLYIIGKFSPPNKLQECDHLYQEMKRWEHSSVIPHFKFLHEHFNGLQILYHNIQSLPKHYKLVSNDKTFMKSHILIFGETWTRPSDLIDFKNYNVLQRSESHDRLRKPDGVWLLAHKSIQTYVTRSGSTVISNGMTVLRACWIEVLNICFLGVYANPNPSLKHFSKLFQYIEKFFFKNIIVIGDFNINLNKTYKHLNLISLAKQHGLKLQNPNSISTDGGTSINWILSSFKVKNGMYSSFFSYHEPLWVRIPA